MISIEQYFTNPTTGEEKAHSGEETARAHDLLERVNALLDEAEMAGAYDPAKVNPHTGTQISGSKGGSGDGGFRLPNATTGAAKSSHKEARAVDVYDPGNTLDNWITGNEQVLEDYGLYREHPAKTETWCHLTTRSPGSGTRTFWP